MSVNTNKDVKILMENRLNEKTPTEKSAEMRRGLEQRYGLPGRARWLLESIQKRPGEQETHDSLEKRIREVAGCIGTIEDFGKTDYERLSPEQKVQLHEAIEKLRFYARHAFAEAPSIETVQRGWEGAPSEVQNVKEQLEMRRDVLAGKIDVSKISEMELSMQETQDIHELLKDAESITDEDKRKLTEELDAELGQMANVEAQIKKLAENKLWQDHEAGGKRERCNERAAHYQSLREEGRTLLDRVKDLGK